MKYTYRGHTEYSLSLRTISGNGDIMDYGVFDFEEPLRPYFSQLFAKFVSTGKFVDDGTFGSTCADYLLLLTWQFDDRSLRVSIPNDLITKAQVAAAAGTGDMLDWLGQIIEQVYPVHSNRIVVTDVYAVIYLNYILPEHEPILRHFSEISIEYKPEVATIPEGEINIV